MTQQDPVAEQLAALWVKVLGYGVPIDGASDFFALGGHSLTAIQLCDEANELLQCDLRPEDVFLDPDFASMLVVVERTRGTSPADSQASRP
jgi:acyl carrier protein